MSYLDDITWNSDGLVPAIAQDAATGRVLMVAWMNAEALQLSVDEQRAVLLVAITKKTLAQR